MKLAVSSFAWPADRSAEAAALLQSDASIQGVELVLPMAFRDPATASASEVAAQRALWSDHGLTVVSVQSLAYGRPELQLLGEPAVREKFIDHLTRMAEIAAALGASRMVFGSPANRVRGDLPMDEALHRASDVFRALAPRITPLGVVICIEPNPPIYSGCDFVIHPHEAVELVRLVNDPAVRVQIDTGSIAYDTLQGRPPSDATLQEIIALGGHMHVSVPALLPVRGDDTTQVEIAVRGRPWPGVEWCSIEMRYPAEIPPERAITEAVKAVRAWYPIEPRV